MKYVYSFHEGNKEMRDTLGGKGANLAEMTNLGLPVPKGFTVTTDACKKYYNDNEVLDESITSEIIDHIKQLETETGKKFGDSKNPLLVSVRSGSPISMPGMMDTVLNLGLNEDIVNEFSSNEESKRFIYDSYRRLIQMFADVVKGFPKSSFERKFDEVKKLKGISNDTELTSLDLKEVIEVYKHEYFNYAKEPFPTDPYIQLIETVKAVFRSWNNERAITYRKLNNISSELGTAVNIQEMVYGNKGESCGTGVAFTRNPATGEKELFGEYLMNAQGEDVVAGIRTPQPIDTLKDVMPNCYEEFTRICNILENHYKDMQDMEFTIEDSKLYMLQTRNGKRTTQAAIKIAVDLVNEGMISKEEALLRVNPKDLEQLLHKVFEEESLKSARVIAKGLPASPGAATGKIYFSATDVKNAFENGIKDIILVRLETSPEDIEGMHIAKGVLTIRGGMTSHAAVVARGMGTCCISGCEELLIDEVNKTLTIKDGSIYHEGDWLSLDGTEGNVYGEQIKTTEKEITGDFKTFMNWADDVKKLHIRTNADTKEDAMIAKKFGAEGIGLCRTEHMFFEKERIFYFRQMICASTKEERIKALEKILSYQRNDFESLFRAMEGYSVIIRFLDPPLHEFLPKTKEEISELAVSLNISFENLEKRINSLKEFNPMMGHRGCRLDITYPEIAIMQTQAIIEAAINVKRENIEVTPEIMIPLISDINEFKFVKNIVTKTANEVMRLNNTTINYKLGTMIELPRSAILADEIAKEADFFSFGTNDLTQLTYGFSRDDSEKFLKDYYNKKIFAFDPFQTIDQEGVGTLVDISTKLAKSTNENIELGICGEHGGDPKSIEFFNKIGLTYVSCSPYRVPIARLAAAQAAIKKVKL